MEEVQTGCAKIAKVRARLFAGGIASIVWLFITAGVIVHNGSPIWMCWAVSLVAGILVFGEIGLVVYVWVYTFWVNMHRTHASAFNRSHHINEVRLEQLNL